MSTCSGSLNLQSGTVLNPRDALSSATFTNVVSCLANEVFSSLSDPKTALGAARELNDPAISHMDSAQWATQVESIAGKLRAFGVLLALRPLLQQGWQGSADALGSVFTNGGTTQITVGLDAGRPSSGGGGNPGGGNPSGGGNPGSGGGGGGSPLPGRSETAGGVAHTWTNYTNAGGTEGASIGAGQTVGIECKLLGFKVADGNTWWYRIASSPWNSQYYVSADAFYNSGATSGPLSGTPFVDPAVPDCSTGVTAPPPPTWSETAGGVAHTWTNYTNAGGTRGPSIAGGQTVQIACKVTGFRVADGNTWWYRIAQSPWNSGYYVSADAFYNNGQTSGSLHGTPFVDPAVPNC